MIFFDKIKWREWGTVGENPYNRIYFMLYDEIFDDFYVKNKITYDKFVAFCRKIINDSRRIRKNEIKISEMKNSKYNFEQVYKTLPPEIVKIIKELHKEIKQIYPVYHKNGKIEDFIAPTFCKMFFEIKNNNVKNLKYFIENNKIILADMISKNFNSDIQDKYDYDDENLEVDEKDEEAVLNRRDVLDHSVNKSFIKLIKIAKE